MGVGDGLLLGESTGAREHAAPDAQISGRMIGDLAALAPRVHVVPAAVVVAPRREAQVGRQVERSADDFRAPIVLVQQAAEPVRRGRAVGIEKDDRVAGGERRPPIAADRRVAHLPAGLRFQHPSAGGPRLGDRIVRGVVIHHDHFDHPPACVLRQDRANEGADAAGLVARGDDDGDQGRIRREHGGVRRRRSPPPCARSGSSRGARTAYCRAASPSSRPRVGPREDGDDPLGQRCGGRLDQHGRVLGEHGTMGRDVGGDDRPTRGEVVEDLEGKVAPERARRDQHVRHRQVHRHRAPGLALHDRQDAGSRQHLGPVGERGPRGAVGADQDEPRLRHRGDHRGNGGDQVIQPLIGLESAAVQDDLSVLSKPELPSQRQRFEGRYLARRAGEVPFPHFRPGSRMSDPVPQSRARHHEIRPAEQPALGFAQKHRHRRDTSRGVLSQLLGETRLHVVEERDSMASSKDQRRPRRLFQRVDAGVSLPRESLAQRHELTTHPGAACGWRDRSARCGSRVGCRPERSAIRGDGCRCRPER